MKFSMRGLSQITSFLEDLPRGSKIAAMRAAAVYLIGDARHGLKHNPARVQHDENNPYQWQSENQRRAYFATDGFGGGIPYQRTGNLAGGWTYTESDSNWTSVKLENSTDYAGYVQGDAIQRGHIADGWRKIQDVIATNIRGALQAAQRAVDEYVKAKDRTA